MGSQPFVWRRIVVWSYKQLPFMAPVLKGTEPGNMYNRMFRNIVPTSDTQVLRDFLFVGQRDVDYARLTEHNAKVDTKNMTVAYDRTRNLNPNGDPAEFNKILTFNFWHPGGYIIYDDDEFGSNVGVSQFYSGPTRRSKGNMYIFDIFSGGLASTADLNNVGRISTQSTVYWKER